MGYYVSNYNPVREKQNGESELKETSDYNQYRETHEKPVNKLRYWKTLRQDLEKRMQQEILPLRDK